MRKFAFVALIAGWMACGIGCSKAAAMPGVGGATVTITNNGSPASDVTVVLDISNMGKTAHSTVTTGSNGPSVLDLSDIGKTRVDVYVEVCQNGQHVLIVNSGIVPPDDGTCHDRKKIGGGLWLNGGDTVKVDVGTGTVDVEHGTSTSLTGSQYNSDTYRPVEFYWGFDYLRFREEGEGFNFSGFDATALYNVNSHMGVGFGYSYKALFGQDTTLTRQTYAGVVQESCRHERYTPFAQVQVGGARFSSFGESENGFYMKAGGGVKINLNSNVSVVPAQMFWDYNHLNGMSFNNFDLGAGISFSLGSPR